METGGLKMRVLPKYVCEKCVNSHGPMVEAIQAVLESVYVDEHGDQSPVIGGDLRKVVEQALRLAGEGK